MSAHLLIIALDGADEVMVDKGSADGSLPNLAALRKRGAARSLTAPPGVTDDGLWASFHYGESLGEHGRYNYLKRTKVGGWRMAFEEEGDKEAFWLRLSNQGHRVAVLDAPKGAAPRPMNGVHLADWLVHGRYFHEPTSHPPRLAMDIVARFGAAPPSRCDHEAGPLSDEEAATVEANLARAVDMKRDAALEQLRSEAWDLVIVGFKEIHCAGHGLWDRTGRAGDPVKALLVRIDAAVGELVKAAGEDAVVAVFATTRMQENGSLQHLEGEIVRRLNGRFGESWLKQKARGAWRKLTGTQIPPPVEAWPYNENCTALKLRRPARTLAAVEQAFAGMVEAGGGRPVVQSIQRPSTQEVGARRQDLPDLLIECASGLVPAAVEAPGFGRIAGEVAGVRPGNHASGGFVIGSAAVDDLGRMEDFAGYCAKVLGARA